MTERIRTGNVEPIEVYVTNQSVEPLTGLTSIYIRIRRVSDGFYLDWADDTFKNAAWTTLDQITAEVDATNFPGLYKVTGGFDTSAIVNITADDDYQILTLANPIGAAVVPLPGMLRVGQWVDQIDTVFDKLPTNYLMGSGVQTDKDDEIDAILADTAVMQPLVSTNLDATITSRESEADASSRAIADIAEHDATQVDTTAILADTAVMQPLVSTNLDTTISSRESEADASSRAIADIAEHDATQVDTTAILADTVAILIDTAVIQPLVSTNLDTTISSRESEADASSRAIADIAEHDATQVATTAIFADTAVMQPLVSTNLDTTITSRESEADASSRAIADIAEHNATQVDTTAILVDTAAILIDTAVMQPLVSTNLDTTISSRESEADASSRAIADIAEHNATQVDTAAILADTAVMQPLVSTNLDTTISSRESEADASSRAIADIAEHNATQVDTAAILIDTAVIQPLVSTNLDATVSSRESEADALARAATDLAEHNATQVDTTAILVDTAAILIDTAVMQPLVSTNLDTTISSRESEADASSRAIADIAEHNTTQVDTTAILVDTAVMQPLVSTNLDTTISSRESEADASSRAIADIAEHDATQVDTAAILIDTAVIQPLVSTNLDATISSRAIPGDSMALVAGALDANAVATTGAQEIASETWDALASAHTGAGSMGQLQNYLDASILSRAEPGDLMALDALERQAIVDATWDDLISSHLGVGSLGEALQAASTGSNPIIVAAAVWDRSLVGHTAAGSAGEAQNRLDDILIDTAALDARLPADPADESSQIAQHGTTQAAIAALNDLGSTDVRDAVLADSTTFNGADVAAILADTAALDARLPTDPADESIQLAAHTATQADIAALNDLGSTDVRDAVLADSTPFNGADVAAILADTAALDARLPTDPADESVQLAAHTATQADIAALNDLDGTAIANAVWDEDLSLHTSPGSAGEAQTEAVTVGSSALKIDEVATDWPPTVGSLLDRIVNASAGQTYDPSTDSLEAVRNKIGGL